MTLFSNHDKGRVLASRLGSVGLRRVSMGDRRRLGRIVGRRQQCRGGQNGRAGLAHGHDVEARSELPHEGHHVVDVILQRKGPAGERHVARIAPIGDVDVEGLEQGVHRAAQQRRVMPRHRGDDEHARRIALTARQRRRVALEMQQVTERAFGDDLLADRHALSAERDTLDAEFGFAVASGQALEHFQRGRGRLGRVGIGPGIGGIVERQAAEVGSGPPWRHRGVREFVQVVEHARPP
jgi:hypothetical protein